MEQVLDPKADYLISLGHLYDEIESWLKESPLVAAKSELSIRECRHLLGSDDAFHTFGQSMIAGVFNCSGLSPVERMG